MLSNEHKPGFTSEKDFESYKIFVYTFNSGYFSNNSVDDLYSLLINSSPINKGIIDSSLAGT